MSTSISKSFFDKLFRSSIKYDSLKRNEEKRQKSIILGVYGIIESVCYTALLCFLSWAFFASINILNNGSFDGFILGLILVIVVIAAFLGSIIGLIFSLVNIIYQFRLNKKPIRWIALAIWILCIVAFVACLILFAIL